MVDGIILVALVGFYGRGGRWRRGRWRWALSCQRCLLQRSTLEVILWWFPCGRWPRGRWRCLANVASCNGLHSKSFFCGLPQLQTWPRMKALSGELQSCASMRTRCREKAVRRDRFGRPLRGFASPGRIRAPVVPGRGLGAGATWRSSGSGLLPCQALLGRRCCSPLCSWYL